MDAIVSPHFLSVFQPLRRCSSGVERDTPAALSGRRRDTPLPSLHLPHSLIHSRQGPPATRLSAPIAQTWNFISEGCGGPCDTTLDAFVFLMSRGETLLSAQRLAFLRSVFEEDISYLLVQRIAIPRAVGEGAVQFRG